MKKIYVLLLLTVALTGAAQTLTQAFHEPKAGDVQTSLNLDTSAFSAGLPLSQTGAGVIWDFTKLKADGLTFKTEYDLPSSSTFSTDFPSASLVQKEGANFHVFLRTTSTPTTQTEVLGFRSGSLSTTFTDVAVAAIFPISLGYSHSDNIAGTFSMGALNGNCSGKITSNADATGTITLADGIVYNQVIRVKTVQTLTVVQGFISATIRQTSYDFYNATENFPILGVGYTRVTAFGSPTVSAGVSGNAKSFLAAIPENSRERLFILFPSPVKDYLTLDCGMCENGAFSCEVVDASGKQVLTKELNEHSAIVDVRSLPPGLYTVLVKSKEAFSSRRIVIE